LVARSPGPPRSAGARDDIVEDSTQLAISRGASNDQPLLVWRAGPGRARRGREGPEQTAADDPGITFDPINVGPNTCSGCDDKAIFVEGGQAYVYLLEGCDDDWCYYDNPQGIA
jgi:hypothetical protein